jgi:hypothetical protein
MTNSCENENELCGEFPDHLSDCSLLKKGSTLWSYSVHYHKGNMNSRDFFS